MWAGPASPAQRPPDGRQPAPREQWVRLGLPSRASVPQPRKAAPLLKGPEKFPGSRGYWLPFPPPQGKALWADIPISWPHFHNVRGLGSCWACWTHPTPALSPSWVNPGSPNPVPEFPDSRAPGQGAWTSTCAELGLCPTLLPTGFPWNGGSPES